MRGLGLSGAGLGNLGFRAIRNVLAITMELFSQTSTALHLTIFWEPLQACTPL